MSTTATSALRPQRADALRNRERVLAAARDAFAEHGPDVPLEEIARFASVGIGTLYRHFPDRQALQRAVYIDSIETLCARGSKLRDAAEPYDALRDWLRAQLEHAATHRALGAAVVITMLDHPDEEAIPCVQLRATAADLLGRAQRSGDVRVDVEVDDLCRMVSAIALATDGAPDGVVCADRLFLLMMDGLRAGTAPDA